MDNQPQFIALRCETCGGSLDVPKQNVVGKEDGEFTISGNDVFTCQHCGTKYLPQQSLERFTSESGIIIEGDFVGGDVVYGNKVGGNVIYTDDPVLLQELMNRSNKETAQRHKAAEEPVEQQKTDETNHVKDNVLVGSTDNVQIEIAAQRPKTSKKWWQFWK